MSEELFERYLRNDLDEAGQRELSAILATEEGARAFSEFVQEWTLLGEAALQRVAETKKPRRRTASPRPDRVWIGWAAGLAAAAIFMAAIMTPTRLPPPAPAPPIAQTPPAPTTPPDPPPEPDRPPAPPPQPDRPPLPLSPPVRIPTAPLPTPEPQPPVPKPKPPEPPRPADPTQVARPVLAVLLRVEGNVQVLSASGRRKALTGEKLSPDEGLEVSGLASLEFPDTTRFEIGPETTVDRLIDRAGRKSIVLSRGSLAADVSKQQAGRSVGVITPHAEVAALGTQFSLAVTAESTKLEVREGRVRMTRLPDGASVEVGAGSGSIAAKGQRLESRPVVFTRDFQDGAGYAGTRDASVSGAEPARSLGSSEVLEADGDEIDGKKMYVLLKWDLSDLPQGAVLRSAVITVNVLNESDGKGYPYFEMRRPWSEAEATWTHAAARQPWRAAGLQSPADRGTEALGTFVPRIKGLLSVMLAPQAETMIQGWIRNPATNHGILIASDAVTDGFKFSSRESSHPTLRPRLTLTYTLAGK